MDGVPTSAFKEVGTATILPSRTVFRNSSALSFRECVGEQVRQLRGVAKRGGSEDILKRPAAGQVDADTASCFADARPDLEQLDAQRFNLCGAHRQRQLQAKQVDEVVGETVEQ